MAITEADLEARLIAVRNVGWDLTKQAQSATVSSTKADLTEKAKQAYDKALELIPLAIELGPQWDKIVIARRGINVFDLYRRTGDLSAAESLGQETLEIAIQTQHSSTIIRAHDKLNLLYSAQAYGLIKQCDYNWALEKFRTIEANYDKMEISVSTLDDAIKLTVNRAVNYLNIVRTLLLQDSSNVFDSELANARKYATESLDHLSDIESSSEYNTWKANLYFVFGEISRLSQDWKKALENYDIALEASKNTDYAAQEAVVELHIAYTLCTKPDPDFEHARSHFDNVRTFLDSKSFGIYDSIYLPLVKEVKNLVG